MNVLVSVLMSVHNEPSEFIDLAVRSISGQTYENIELVIIDDHSDDVTFQHIMKLSERYKNIKVYRNKKNLGLTASLNIGLKLCAGEFIARMDADDFSCPSRIAKQVEYLNEHQDIDILGTGVVSFGEKTMFMSPVNGYNPYEVQSNLFFASSLCHPSVMIRKAFLDRTGLTYDESVKKGQDYDLWERASILGKLAVLKDVLLFYRLHPKQITSTNRKEQDDTLRMIMVRRLNRMGIIPTDKDMECHLALMGQNNSASISDIKKWIDTILDSSRDIRYIDSKTLINNLKRRYVLNKFKRHVGISINEIPVAFGILWYRIVLLFNILKFKKRIKFELL